MKALIAGVSGLVLLAPPASANDGSIELAQVFAKTGSTATGASATECASAKSDRTGSCAARSTSAKTNTATAGPRHVDPNLDDNLFDGNPLLLLAQ